MDLDGNVVEIDGIEANWKQMHLDESKVELKAIYGLKTFFRFGFSLKKL